MFFKKKYVIVVTSKSILVYKVSLGHKAKAELFSEFQWTKENLEEIFVTIRKRFGSVVSILIHDSFVYVAVVTLPKNTFPLNQAVKDRAQEQIPENLDETIWDFKRVNESTGSETLSFQLIAITKEFLGAFSAACNNAGIRISALEPISYTIARNIPYSEEPQAIVYSGEAALLVAMVNGYIRATQVIDSPVNSNVIQDFLHEMKEGYSLTIKHILLLSAGAGIDIKSLEDKSMVVQLMPLNPIVALAKSRERGKKEQDRIDLLSSTIVAPSKTAIKIAEKKDNEKETKENANNPEEKEHQAASGKPWVLFLTITFIFMILGFGAFYFFSTKGGSKTVTPSPTPTAAIVVVPTKVEKQASPAASLDKKAYSITVLNGSTKNGEAARLQTLLSDEGYDVVEIGNADSKEYESTTIIYPEDVSEGYKVAIDKFLKTLYDDIVENEESDTSSDVTIIIGNN